MRARVVAKEQPWLANWELLRTQKLVDGVGSDCSVIKEQRWDRQGAELIASLDFKPDPLPAPCFENGDPLTGRLQMYLDSAAAYTHALQWAVTGDERHARKTAEILDAWATTVTNLPGDGMELTVGYTAYRFCNAAEIIRHTWTGWPPASIERFSRFMTNLAVPKIINFKPHYNGNWDASMIDSLMAIGIFTDRRDLFNRAVDYYRLGKGNGALTNYLRVSGQCQESTRDQVHVQVGLGHLANACEQAWNQGVDLWGEAGNRLLRGYEYTAAYNLGNEVPCDGKISGKYRGRFYPIYEMVYRHYHGRKNLPMPFTRKAIEQQRSHGGEGLSLDPNSWGTLAFAVDPL